MNQNDSNPRPQPKNGIVLITDE